MLKETKKQVSFRLLSEDHDELKRAAKRQNKAPSPYAAELVLNSLRGETTAESEQNTADTEALQSELINLGSALHVFISEQKEHNNFVQDSIAKLVNDNTAIKKELSHLSQKLASQSAQIGSDVASQVTAKLSSIDEKLTTQLVKLSSQLLKPESDIQYEQLNRLFASVQASIQEFAGDTSEEIREGIAGIQNLLNSKLSIQTDALATSMEILLAGIAKERGFKPNEADVQAKKWTNEYVRKPSRNMEVVR